MLYKCSRFFYVESYIRVVDFFIFVFLFVRSEEERREEKDEMCDLYKRQSAL